MNIQNKRFLFLAQYAAPYEGNFIASLKALEESLVKGYACEVAYVFPEATRKQKWIEAFAAGHKTYFTRDDVQNSSEELEKVREEFHPDVVHTHFDGYDVVAAQVFGNTKDCYQSKAVWHMHNHISFISHPLKALYQVWAFMHHYGLMSKGVSIISVSEAMKDFARRWSHLALRRSANIQCIPNGIDLGRVYQKRVSGLLSAKNRGGVSVSCFWWT